MITTLLPLGRVLATPGALAAFGEFSFDYFLSRHVRGDWGNVCEEDKTANDYAADNDERVLSSYTVPSGAKLWIITEADRSCTTLLLPEEY